MLGLSKVKIIGNYVINRTLLTIPYGQIRYINAQLNELEIHYSDHTLGQVTLFFIYDSITCLANFYFMPNYKMPVSDPSILDFYQNTDKENYQCLKYGFNNFVKSIVVYSSGTELLLIRHLESHFYCRKPKHYNIFAESLEDSQQLVLSCLSKEIDEYKRNPSYRKKASALHMQLMSYMKKIFLLKKEL